MEFVLFAYFIFLLFTFFRAEWYVLSLPIYGAERKREWVFASYDVWIGTYLDKKHFAAYWFPVPFIGMKHYWTVRFNDERPAERRSE